MLGLAREIGCSQGPIREALLRLQEDGLVVRSGRRTVVTRLEAEEAEEMLALRRRIETRGALKAVLHADTRGLDELRDILAAMKEAAALGDEYRVIEPDKDFHLALFRLSGLDACAGRDRAVDADLAGDFHRGVVGADLTRDLLLVDQRAVEA